MDRERKNKGYENRQYVRLDADYMLRHAPYKLTEDQDDKAIKGVVKDYSTNGVLFGSEVQYNLGDLLKLEIAIPGWNRLKNKFYAEDQLLGSESVVVLALVMRVECLKPDQMFDIGVWFVGIDEGDRWTLMKQIKERLKKR